MVCGFLFHLHTFPINARTIVITGVEAPATVTWVIADVQASIRTLKTEDTHVAADFRALADPARASRRNTEKKRNPQEFPGRLVEC